MERRFEASHVVVTGGASGIGAGCVDRFNAEGATCHVLDVSGPQRHVDVRDEQQVAAFFDGLTQPPDVVVNAAGTGAGARLVDLELDEWRRVLDINLTGTFLCLRAAARRMMAAGRPGVIVNISSINESWPLNGFGPYCASKAGVAMLTRVAALELAPHRVRVNAVAPGPIDTPLARNLSAVPGFDDEVATRTPYEGRWGRPSEVAAVVAFLASEDGRWVVGRSLTVDGGHSLIGEPDPLVMAERAMSAAGAGAMNEVAAATTAVPPSAQSAP